MVNVRGLGTLPIILCWHNQCRKVRLGQNSDGTAVPLLSLGMQKLTVEEKQTHKFFKYSNNICGIWEGEHVHVLMHYCVFAPVYKNLWSSGKPLSILSILCRLIQVLRQLLYHVCVPWPPCTSLFSIPSLPVFSGSKWLDVIHKRRQLEQKLSPSRSSLSNRIETFSIRLL